MSEKKLVAQRDAYGLALVELGKANPNVAVLDADVSKSTKTVHFANEFPERFFNFGIAEQNMMAAAAGMAKSGIIPFVNTFSFLVTYRAADQLRSSVVYPKANVKIAATYGGLSDSFDGPTHQSIADLSMVRALPNLTVVVPADAVEVEKALPVLANYNGPVWFRLSRNPSPVIYGDDYEFTIGKASILQEGSDLTLISLGTMLGRVMEAAELLRKEGLNPTVMSISTLKPLDKESILAAARKTGALVTVEEHTILGGLGAAVCETVADQYPVPVKRVGIPDTFADTGPYEELLDKYGLSVQDIVKAAKEAHALKK